MLYLSKIVVDEGEFLLKCKMQGVSYFRGLGIEEQKELHRAIETLRLIMEGDLGRYHPDSE